MSKHHDSDQLGQRIRALVDHHVSDEVRARHLAAMDAELAHQPHAVTNEATIRLPALWRARRWLAGLAATATVLTPGMAVAAHDAVPGDTLYGVKRATEHLHRLVTPDVAAHNRVAELAALLDRDTPPHILADASGAARDAVAPLPDGHPLHDELAALLARNPGQQGEGAAPPPPTSTADDEREHGDQRHEEGGDEDHSEPDGHDDDTDDTGEDTGDVEDGDDLDNDTNNVEDDTNDVEDSDELDDDTDEPDQHIEQSEPDDDTDDGYESQDASSAEDDDDSDQDD